MNVVCTNATELLNCDGGKVKHKQDVTVKYELPLLNEELSKIPTQKEYAREIMQ